MQSHVSRFVTFGGLALASACASAPPPATRAASVEQTQCDSSAASQEALVRSTRVLSVQPLYSHVMTSNTSEERVDGAKLIVRPPSAVSAEQMTRILQCHGARVLLGQVSPNAVRNDPYWLPDSWVNIQVSPENGNFAVTLSADTVRGGIQVFGHASQYADDHMLATQPELP